MIVPRSLAKSWIAEGKAYLLRYDVKDGFVWAIIVRMNGQPNAHVRVGEESELHFDPKGMTRPLL